MLETIIALKAEDKAIQNKIWEELQRLAELHHGFKPEDKVIQKEHPHYKGVIVGFGVGILKATNEPIIYAHVKFGHHFEGFDEAVFCKDLKLLP